MTRKHKRGEERKPGRERIFQLRSQRGKAANESVCTCEHVSVGIFVVCGWHAVWGTGVGT